MLAQVSSCTKNSMEVRWLPFLLGSMVPPSQGRFAWIKQEPFTRGVLGCYPLINLLQEPL